MKWSNAIEANRFYELFNQAAHIVSGNTYRYDETVGDYRRPYEGREWFRREYNAHHLHPAVYSMMKHYKPDDWHQLLLEWPHKSMSDPNRLAYTRDERSGEADRQVITTIGKYLFRHFSDAPDNLIRDIAAEHTYGGTVSIVTDMDEMISAVINGPGSCMSKHFNVLCDDGTHRHPYAVYDPSLGWAMAIRKEDGKVLGRCLLWHDPDAEEENYRKIFVRAYKRERDACAHSGADEAIEMYLRGLGYVKHNSWTDGTPILSYPLRSGGYLMPYIDGGTQRVEERSGGCLYIDEGGEIEADNTDGRSDYNNCTCDDCGERFNDEDGGAWVGRNEDAHVCDSCLNDGYTYAIGRRGNSYYVTNDEAVYVESQQEYFHTDYLSDNNIVCLANGDYEHSDNAVYVESQDEYYHQDDDDICYAEDTGDYALKSDCWQCTATNNWYTEDTDSVEVDGDLYHPDDAPETEDQDESGAAA